MEGLNVITVAIRGAELSLPVTCERATGCVCLPRKCALTLLFNAAQSTRAFVVTFLIVYIQL